MKIVVIANGPAKNFINYEDLRNYMQSIIGSLASSFGIPPALATTAVNGITQMLMQKSTPKATSGLLNALPQDVTGQISEADKQKLTTTQVNLNRYDLLKQISGITGIKDIDKLDNFADAVMDSIKKNANINLSDGLSKEELFQAMQDLSKDHLSKA